MKKLLHIILLLPILGWAQTAKEYVEQGKAMYHSWATQPAVPFLQSMANIKPQPPKKSAKQMAIELFTKAIKVDPGYAPAYRERARVKAYALMITINNMSRKDYRSLIADYTEAIKLAPDDTDSYYNRALTEYLHKDNKKSTTDLEKLIVINPKSRHTYFREIVNRSNSRHEYKASLKAMDQLAKLEPNYTLAYYYMGLTHRMMSDYNAAILDYDKAIALGAKYYADRSFVKELAGDYQGALDDKVEDLKIRKPERISGNDMMRLGSLYGKVGNNQAAIESYTKAITFMTPTIEKGELYQSEFGIIDPYEERAKIETRVGQLDKAMADYNTTLKYNRLPGLLNGRAELKYLINNKKGACEDWNEAYHMAANTLHEWAAADSIREARFKDGKPYQVYMSNRNTKPDTLGYSKIIVNIGKYCK